jgi:ACS family allantoate permease-like MFS transporter
MFLIFGVFTTLFGVSLWWILPDSPVTAPFLSDRERRITIDRLQSNKTGVKNTHHKKEQVIEALTDLKVWLLVAAVFCHNMTNSLQNTFTGIIIKGFGYSTYEAVLLNLPQYGIFVVVAILVVGFLTTKMGEGKRIIFIIIMYIPGVVSSVLLYTIPVKHSTRGIHLYAVFTLLLVTVSTIITYGLLSSNVAGYTKKTVAGAMFFSAYCISNIISPQVFLQSESPRYPTGVAVTLACFAINMVLFAILYIVYSRENRKRDREAADAGSTMDNSQSVLDGFMDLTGKHNQSFRYKL